MNLDTFIDFVKGSIQLYELNNCKQTADFCLGRIECALKEYLKYRDIMSKKYGGSDAQTQTQTQ